MCIRCACRIGCQLTWILLSTLIWLWLDPRKALYGQTEPSEPHVFAVRFDAGAIVSLRHAGVNKAVEYIQPGQRLGDLVIRYRRSGEAWQSADTVLLAHTARFSEAQDGIGCDATYLVQEDGATVLSIGIQFSVYQKMIVWRIRLCNQTADPLEIGDLALPLPISRGSSGGPHILKHSFISGHGSFLFWIRSDSTGPCLVLTPADQTHLEYWDTQGTGQRRQYKVYIHSVAAGQQARHMGTNWRQPHTSRVLAPSGKAGDWCSYEFHFRWAEGYDGIRQVIVEEGGIDIHVVPGMTVPVDLFARLALRAGHQIRSIEAEFPQDTVIEPLGMKSGYRLYQVRFLRLGENRLKVRYGENKHIYLEFFCTESVETLIRKRAAFLAKSQHRDPTKWYDGLITDWNMETKVLLSPENYDRIPPSRIYAVTCDDPGLAKPAFLAAKNAHIPSQVEVEALDYYIEHFVWGGLQRTTQESYPFGIYGIQDWKRNRDSNDPGRNGKLHIWRVYDYPHVILMYFDMYKVAKDFPHIRTALTARQYLERAFGTAQAMFTIPRQINGWSAYGTGFYNELVILDLIEALKTEGMKSQADKLTDHWERKVRYFVSENPDLFRSEYTFDSTGFESTHAIARYAIEHAGALGIPPEAARAFMDRQIAANIFCRGWIEPAYYYLGSDYRGGAGNAYTLTYMSQMGGWGVMDYGLHFAGDPYPYIRLGYASYLSSWALMNTGTPESNYGYWYPGKANDGAAGGGFEPAPYGVTWLGQPHHRGSWYYACEIDLGYCGALRAAATILADDPIFGRFCYGGHWSSSPEGIEVICKDGLRKRFFARLGSGRVDLISELDRFAADRPVILKEDLSEIRFWLEAVNPTKHLARIRIAGLRPGRYLIEDKEGWDRIFQVQADTYCAVQLPMQTAVRGFVIRFTGND